MTYEKKDSNELKNILLIISGKNNKSIYSFIDKDEQYTSSFQNEDRFLISTLFSFEHHREK
jgi:hypothetical protein